jgi:hypothetical protein
MNDLIQPPAKRLAKLADTYIVVRKREQARVQKSPAVRPVYLPVRKRPATAASVSSVRSYLRLERC